MMDTISIPFSFHLSSEGDWSADDGQPDRAADLRPLDTCREIIVEFRYPFRNSLRRILINEGGFTRRDFALAVSHEYERLYDEEEKSRTVSPTPKGLLLNRSETDGVHGIWGHDLPDLVLEGARRDEDGVWHLDIGS